jgi:hypothetical protein
MFWPFPVSESLTDMMDLSFGRLGSSPGGFLSLECFPCGRAAQITARNEREDEELEPIGL